ncbi:hypothetical protein LIER_37611 [Lithospermum erythrorhizon]|uniref:Zinc knuckle CX2CX4HX4C domain-containing protein n=1 Tax=Lithospermum erythrorhizon TaxID=34254 RepID=A0AAV3PSY5_LITER
MDVNILRSLLSCNLIEEEALPIQLEEFELADGIVECEESVYVKIHSLNDNFVSIQGFSMAMSNAWNCKDLRVARVLGPILQVFFPSLEENERVCGKGGKKFFRLRATINLNQPLHRLLNFSVEGGLGTGYLAYERLPYLCFHCGLMGHLIKQSPVIPTSVERQDVCIYCLWIKAPLEKSWLEFKLELGKEALENQSLDSYADGKRDTKGGGGAGKCEAVVVAPNVFPGFEPRESLSNRLGAVINGTLIAGQEGTTVTNEELNDQFQTGNLNSNSNLNQELTISGVFIRGENIAEQTWSSHWLHANDQIFHSSQRHQDNNQEIKGKEVFQDLPRKSKLLKTRSSVKRHHPCGKNDHSSSSSKKPSLSGVGLEGTSTKLPTAEVAEQPRRSQ